MTTNVIPIPNYVDRKWRKKTKSYAIHNHNPAGSKLIRRTYKFHFGKRVPIKKAKEWYDSLVQSNLEV